MADPFESSRRKIARAQHHIDDLEAQIASFLNERPYEIVIESDSEAGCYIHKVRLTKPMPDPLALIASDAVGNLRASLDHMSYTVARASGCTNPKHYHFIVRRSSAGFDSCIDGRCKDLPKEIVTLFRAFQPYKGGNDSLWALNEICNRDKHAVVVPAFIVEQRIDIYATTDDLLAPTSICWDRSKNEMELFRSRTMKDQTKYNFSLGFQIAFDVPESVNRRPMLTVLNAFRSEVERVLMAVEAETRRLFPANF